MAQCVPRSRWQQNLQNQPSSGGVYQKAVQNYLQKFLPLLIVYFSTSNVGLRRLQYFCKELLHYSITIGQIKQIIQAAAQNAEQYLVKWDRIAGEHTQILEMDTTWKGKMRKFFGVIAQQHRYLFVLQPIKNEQPKTLRPILEHVANTCINVKYIITDMALGFKGLIRGVFATATHLFCHLHIFRLFHREWSDDRKKFRKVRVRLQKTKGPVDTTKKWIRKNRKHGYHSANYLHKMQQTKLEMCHRLKIGVNANGSIKNRGGGLHPALTPISTRIYRAQVKVLQFHYQINRQLQKLKHTIEKYQIQRIEYTRAWVHAMIPAKLRKLLKMTLHASTLGQFQINKARLKQKLHRSTFKGAKKLLKLINSTPFLHTAKTYLDSEIEKFSISTNTMEGFFAQCRMLLDELRNAPDTVHIRSRLTLLRYWHNSIGPLSGFDRKTSPCSRVGIRFGSKNPIRLICTNILLP
jgi:hypothetical protein